jgi:hypothetical protein
VKATSLTVDRRYCGPPDWANGGYVGGRLFELLDPASQAAQVTLRRPVPLGVELTVAPARRGVDLLRGDEVLAEADPAWLTLEVRAPVSFAEAQHASEGFPTGVRYQFPGCFVCGSQRRTGDGLRIRPGPVPRRDVVAAPWVPHGELTGEGDLVRQRYVWAALDCPGAYALHLAGAGEDPLVLGRMTAKILHPVAAGERCVVTAWPLGSDGKRQLAATALFNDQGWLVGLASQVWFRAEGKVPGA